MKNILKYIALTAVRDRFFITLAMGMLGILGISTLLGYTAMNEQGMMQTAVFAGSARILLAGGIAIFICFYLARSFENMEIPFILSGNISRGKLVFTYWLGFNILTQILLAFLAILMFLSPGKINFWGAVRWFCTVELELAIVIGFCVAVGLIIKSPVFSALTTFGFYILARMMGFFTGLFFSFGDNKIITAATRALDFLFRAIASLAPRLDLFGQTVWLTYGGDPKVMTIILIQSLIYIPLLLLIALHDFKKKQF
ncbi:MAG: hypothetical protein LBB09_00860 [Rickettsiales bacterium]|jgi:hypothetical protein|nr:hypothetical protein [Rickettsiales bacterium]